MCARHGNGEEDGLDVSEFDLICVARHGYREEERLYVSEFDLIGVALRVMRIGKRSDCICRSST